MGTMNAVDLLQQKLHETLNIYEAALASQEEAAARKKEADEAVENLKNHIIDMIADIEDTYGVTAAATSDSFKYTITRKSYYRVTPENKDFAIRSLRALKLGDIIQQRVDDRTLTKCLREIEDSYRGEDGTVTLPKRYSNLLDHLETYDKATLYKRKK